MEPHKIKRWRIIGAVATLAAVGSVGVVAAQNNDSSRTKSQTTADSFIRVVSVNIGRNAPRKECTVPTRVKREIATVPNTLIGWQEIGESDDCDERGALRTAFTAPWRNTGIPTHTPISRSIDDWQTLHTYTVLSMLGIPGVSPNRYVTMVRMLNRSTGQRITLLNTHMIADPERNERRLALWNAHWNRLMRITERERGYGNHVLITGDFNRWTLPAVPHGKRVAHRAVDWIIAVPAKGYAAEKLDGGNIPLHIDAHGMLWADVRFVR